jgi:uncharacterized membrane protein
MERMLVAVFDDERMAFEGRGALRQLEREGNLTIFEGAVVVKGADGRVSVRQIDDSAPTGTLAGTAVGSLVGLLAGPVGAAIGAASAATIGAIYDADTLRVGEDFVDDVSKSLTPGKVAVVAEVDEAWTAPVDARMEALGGTVFRRALWLAQEEVRREEIAAMKAVLADFKSEMSKANAERKVKLEKKIRELQAKIDARIQRAEGRRKSFETREKAKAAILKQKAAAAGRALKELANTPI